MASLSFVFQPCGRCVTTDGSFSPSVDKYELLMDLVQDAVAAGGFSLGTDLHIALNCAASEFYDQASTDIVSFAAVIRVVTQCSSPTNGCSLELCIPFPLLLRTNDMHETVSSCTNHISCYICRQRSRFPYGSLILIGQFKERNAELE